MRAAKTALAAAFGEGPEQQAAADFASGVLNGRQVQALGLRPVVRDIVQILGSSGDLLKQGPLRLDVREVLFALIFAAALLDQAMRAPDALQGAMGNGQIEFPDQASGPEGGQGLAQLDELRF
jgi:hypothetical protein